MSKNIINITKENFEQEVLKSDTPVMVDFWASWCGPCRMVAPIMDELSEEVTDAKICKVNVDDEGELAAQYRIMSIPTIMIFKNGEVVEKIVGARTKEEFLELLNKQS